LVGFFASVISVAIFFGLYVYFAVPPVDKDRVDGYVSNMKAGAHRGLALDAPENTMAAFRLSKELKADSIEFDLEFTSDGMAVILHDDTLDRTTDGTGRIDQTTWEQVQKLNAAAKFTGGVREFKKEKIPTLEETLQLGMELGMKMFIDVKTTHELVVPTITKMFRKYPELYNTTSVCSFYPTVVYQVKRADPNIITGHTWHIAFITHTNTERKQRRHVGLFKQIGAEILQRVYLWSLHNWLWKWTGINLVLAHHEEVTREYVEMWRERNVQVVGWTVNDLEEKRLYLKTLKCPFLSDRLSDMQEDL